MDVKTFLKDNILLFDGGMGTYFSQKMNKSGDGCEKANVDNPILISAIHGEYIEADAKAIKTNTFAANRLSYDGDSDYTKRVISAGYKLAVKAAEKNGAFVFADIGPINPTSGENPEDEYKFVADCFLEQGASNFIFETNANLNGIVETAAYIKRKNPEAFIIVSFAVMPEGFTRDGLFVRDLVKTAENSGNFDVCGMNCISSATQMKGLVETIGETKLPLITMPNAGYPVVLGNRTFYKTEPEFFAEGIKELCKMGVKILGGCCGTSPKHIAAAAKTLQLVTKEEKAAVTSVLKPATATKEKIDIPEDPDKSLFWKKLETSQKPIAVELDPPENAQIAKYMSGVRTLRYAGADIITIADCPIARARMDSSILACKVKRELGMEAIPHMTCRDRNINATKALLLGLSAEGIRNVLLVTGDPIPSADRDEVKSVYQFNSRKMASFVSSLGENALDYPFHIFGALNVNAVNFDVQLKMAKEKIERGMVGFLTQPVLSKEALENLKRAHEELDGYILGGIMPVVSERNARFMDSEINGINVANEITERYVGLDRTQGEDLAVEISTDIAEKMKDFVDGYYVMTPFNRTGLVKRIIEKIGENK